MVNGDSFETTLAAASSRRQSPPPVRPNLLFPFTIHHSPFTGRPPLSCRTSPPHGGRLAIIRRCTNPRGRGAGEKKRAALASSAGWPGDQALTEPFFSSRSE